MSNTRGTFNFYDGILKGKTAAKSGSITNIEPNYSIIEPIVSIDQAVEQLEYVYNRNLKPLSAHLDIHGLYKSYLKSTAMLNAIARKSRNEKV